MNNACVMVVVPVMWCMQVGNIGFKNMIDIILYDYFVHWNGLNITSSLWNLYSICCTLVMCFWKCNIVIKFVLQTNVFISKLQFKKLHQNHHLAHLTPGINGAFKIQMSFWSHLKRTCIIWSWICWKLRVMSWIQRQWAFVQSDKKLIWWELTLFMCTFGNVILQLINYLSGSLLGSWGWLWFCTRKYNSRSVCCGIQVWNWDR